VRRNLVIAGGSRGIGRATALLAAERGYDVAFCYRSERARADALVLELQERGARALAVQADIGDAVQVARFFDAATAGLGLPDAVVVAAGVTGKASRLADAPVDVVRETGVPPPRRRLRSPFCGSCPTRRATSVGRSSGSPVGGKRRWALNAWR
jgi:NAD(P)-dependent dehydrogenase (short-subunit alcohol dehydrogenase family)